MAQGIVITPGGFEVNSFPPMPLQPGGGTGRGICLLRDVSEVTRSPQWLYSQMGERGKGCWLAGWAGWAGLAGQAGLAGLGWAGWGEISDLMGSRRMYLDPSGSCYLLHGSSILRKSHVSMIYG